MLNMYPITSIIRITIKVSCSIASPPNLMSRGKYPLKIKGLTAYLYIGLPYSNDILPYEVIFFNIYLQEYTKAKDIHQSGECPKNLLFMRFFAYLKYLPKRPSNALP